MPDRELTIRFVPDLSAVRAGLQGLAQEVGQGVRVPGPSGTFAGEAPPLASGGSFQPAPAWQAPPAFIPAPAGSPFAGSVNSPVDAAQQQQANAVRRTTAAQERIAQATERQAQQMESAPLRGAARVAAQDQLDTLKMLRDQGIAVSGGDLDAEIAGLESRLAPASARSRRRVASRSLPGSAAQAPFSASAQAAEAFEAPAARPQFGYATGFDAGWVRAAQSARGAEWRFPEPPNWRWGGGPPGGEVIDAEWEPAGRRQLPGPVAAGGAARGGSGGGAPPWDIGDGLADDGYEGGIGREIFEPGRNVRRPVGPPAPKPGLFRQLGNFVTAPIGGKAGQGVYFNLLFGGLELLHARRAVSQAEAKASVATNPLDELNAIADGIDQGTGGFFGGLGGLFQDLRGNGPSQLRTVAVTETARGALLQQSGDLLFQSQQSAQLRTAGLVSDTAAAKARIEFERASAVRSADSVAGGLRSQLSAPREVPLVNGREIGFGEEWLRRIGSLGLASTRFYPASWRITEGKVPVVSDPGERQAMESRVKAADEAKADADRNAQAQLASLARQNSYQADSFAADAGRFSDIAKNLSPYRVSLNDLERQYNAQRKVLQFTNPAAVDAFDVLNIRQFQALQSGERQRLNVERTHFEGLSQTFQAQMRRDPLGAIESRINAGRDEALAALPSDDGEGRLRVQNAASEQLILERRRFADQRQLQTGSLQSGVDQARFLAGGDPRFQSGFQRGFASDVQGTFDRSRLEALQFQQGGFNEEAGLSLQRGQLELKALSKRLNEFQGYDTFSSAGQIASNVGGGTDDLQREISNKLDKLDDINRNLEKIANDGTPGYITD